MHNATASPSNKPEILCYWKYVDRICTVSKLIKKVSSLAKFGLEHQTIKKYMYKESFKQLKVHLKEELKCCEESFCVYF